MTLLLAKIAEWFLKRLIWIALLTVVAVLGVGTFYYLRENVVTEQSREQRWEQIQAQLPSLKEARIALEQQWEEISATLQEMESSLAQRSVEIQRRKEQLAAMLGIWNEVSRLWSEEARDAHRQRERQLEQIERSHFRDLRILAVRREEWRAVQENLTDVDEEMAALRTETATLEAGRSIWFRYLHEAWDRLLPSLLLVALLILFGPILWKAVRFYLVAPFMVWGRGIHLRDGPYPLPSLSAREVSQDLGIGPTEHVMIKPEFLQASDESLRRRTRWLLDWAIPFTSLACRLSMMVELRGRKEENYGRVTISSQDNSEVELNTLQLAEGSRMVLRPRFLAAVAKERDHPIRIHRHWRLFHLHSWITLQFRYFEFEGPCRLVVWGLRGARMEVLDAHAETTPAAKRTNQNATIGFTPQLHLHATRAETFWTYARGQNPLFDDLFSGEGAFLCQEITRRSDHGLLRRWTTSFWDGLLKIFGW